MTGFEELNATDRGVRNYYQLKCEHKTEFQIRYYSMISLMYKYLVNRTNIDNYTLTKWKNLMFDQ